MTSAFDRQRHITETLKRIYSATNNTVTLTRKDYDFLVGRGAIDSLKTVDGVPVRRQ